MEQCDTQTEGSKGGETVSDTLSLGVIKLAASPITPINFHYERSEAANVFGTLATFLPAQRIIGRVNLDHTVMLLHHFRALT